MAETDTEDAPPAIDTFQALDAIYDRFREAESIPGLVYGVVQHGRLIHSKSFGLARVEPKTPVKPDSFFRIASMTKVITALAILKLRDRGSLGLDAPIADLVPAFKDIHLPTTDSRPITVRDMLTHVGGFVTDDPWGDRLLGQTNDDFDLMLAKGLNFARAPKLAFEYANLGYTVLGRVIQNITKEPYSAFVRRELLQPLGMVRTTFEYRDLPEGALALGYRWAEQLWSPTRLEPDGSFGAMAGIVTNAPEYARFIAFLLDAWPSRDTEDQGPVSRASRRELVVMHSEPHAPSIRTHQGRAIATASAYGYGIINSIEPELGRYYHHRGGLPGYGSHFLVSPETGTGIFSFGNRTYAAMNEPNIEAAQALKDMGQWRAAHLPVSAHLALAVDAVSRIYRARRIEQGKELFAENVLLDRPAVEWNRALAEFAHQLGDLRHIDAVPNHALSAKLTLVCEKGSAQGEVILTGEAEPRIQSLSLETVPAGA